MYTKPDLFLSGIYLKKKDLLRTLLTGKNLQSTWINTCNLNIGLKKQCNRQKLHSNCKPKQPLYHNYDLCFLTILKSNLNFIFKTVLSLSPFSQICKFKPTAGHQFHSFSFGLICWDHQCSVSITSSSMLAKVISTYLLCYIFPFFLSLEEKFVIEVLIVIFKNILIYSSLCRNKWDFPSTRMNI